jgi:uroporphyrinogen decarboxylase
MTRREVVRMVLDGEEPPYVPWSFKFTREPEEILLRHYGVDDLDGVLQNHILQLGNDIGFFEDLGRDHFRDVFGVVWDRTIDKDIGTPVDCVIKEPSLEQYTFPDPLNQRFFDDIERKIENKPDMFRVFQIGFSLFERAWTLRGMENLLMDFILHPEFVREFMQRITDYNLVQVKKAMEYDIDAIYFGDDWGQQRGLIMGYEFWKEYIFPQLERMYRTVKEGQKYVMIHSCGDVEELFDDLIDIGLDCFNPFQPEVMDVRSLMVRYRGKLCFHGGLSIQKILPFGTPEDVRRESHELIRLGRMGGYIFSPSHAVEGDTSLENILSFVEVAMTQDGYIGTKPE